MNWTWMTNTNVLAQEGHFLFGWFFITLSNIVMHTPIHGLWLGLTYIIIKEIIFDPAKEVEGDPFFWDGALDMLVFCGGMSFALVLLL